MLMTWGELKERVDDELKMSGKDDSIEIEYIDIQWPDRDGPQSPEVYVREMLVVH